MNTRAKGLATQYAPALGVICLIAIAVIAYGAYLYQAKVKELASAQAQITALTAERADLQTKIIELEGNLALARDENEELNDELDEERERNDEFEDRIEDIAGTVGVLDKLSKTDPELLQKYSKVYFLNEHYVPDRLKKVDQAFLLTASEDEYIHTDVSPYLNDLLGAAKREGYDLRVLSGYRSFRDQTSLKSQYKVVYGSGANQFSADQGYSEHQLGTTVDLTTAQLRTLDGFGATEAYQWLSDNAHKYGFILSYPDGNAYYEYEPWHWRFVGVDLARDLNRQNKNFYDAEQRWIDEYLVKIFD